MIGFGWVDSSVFHFCRKVYTHLSESQENFLDFFFFFKFNPVTAVLARLFSHHMKTLQVNSSGERMNGVVHDMSVKEASRG